VPVLVEPGGASSAVLVTANTGRAMPRHSGSHQQADSELPFHEAAAVTQLRAERELEQGSYHCSTCTQNTRS